MHMHMYAYRQHTAFYFKLSYPKTRSYHSFTSILASSMSSTTERRVWCDKCKQYQYTKHTKTGTCAYK